MRAYATNSIFSTIYWSDTDISTDISDILNLAHNAPLFPSRNFCAFAVKENIVFYILSVEGLKE